MSSATTPQLEPSKRLALVGRTGAGKTYLGKWFMLRAGLRWVVLDTKHDPAFASWKPVDGLQSMRTLSRFWKDRQFVVVRPKPHETNPVILDAYVGDLHEGFDRFGCMIDETYQLARNSQPGPGLTGIVTRGRARSQAVIMGSQRPAWVPRFVFSEADYLAVMSLSLLEDRKRVFDFTGGRPEVMDKLPSRYWYWFDVASERLQLYSPVSVNPT